MLSGQVETNPGPRSPVPIDHSIENMYPCGSCKNEVKDEDRALLCDKCELWFHTKCIENPNLDYSTLMNKTSFSWICCECGFPNFDSTLFCTQSINSSNPVSVLSELDGQADFETNDTTFPKTSTPIKTTGTDRKSPTFKKRKHGLRAMIIVMV